NIQSSFFFIYQCLTVMLVSFTMPANGPRLGDSGGLESQNFQSFTNLSNSFLLFTKLTKKEI
ncbi:hypothetical protein ACPDHJ_15495, partial [Myroides sp. C8-3]|uniref:hypothetical protein n=1 Tax=Myroides sp. C8-3 TaxID=3400533 RepID=UPI003D2F639A